MWKVLAAPCVSFVEAAEPDCGIMMSPVQKNMKGKDMGELNLKPSSGKNTEICLTLDSSSNPGTPVFDNLSNIRFTLTHGGKGWSGELQGVEEEKAEADTPNGTKPARIAAAPTAVAGEKGGNNTTTAAGNPESKQTGLQPIYERDWVAQDSVLDTWEDLQAENNIHKNLMQTAAMQQVEKDTYRNAALKVAAGRSRESLRMAGTPPEQQWDNLRQQYGWPAGQGELLESMFSPYESEGIDSCAQCQPQL